MGGAIVGYIVKAILSFIEDFFSRKKAEADEWNAKSHEMMLKSVKATDDMESIINNEKGTVPATVAEWNTNGPGSAAAALLLVVVLLPGCFTKYVPVETPLPMIEVPVRPTLPQDPPEFTAREKLILGWGTTLEARIKKHNELARERNNK